ncbi:hypothetical protein RBB80_15130 [Tunturiibacter gelidiferens]
MHDEIVASPYPKMPLLFSEYNASYSNEPDVTDTTYMGPWLANNIRQCDGLTESMSYWSFSDVFEEQGSYGRRSTEALASSPPTAFPSRPSMLSRCCIALETAESNSRTTTHWQPDRATAQ